MENEPQPVLTFQAICDLHGFVVEELNPMTASTKLAVHAQRNDYTCTGLHFEVLKDGVRICEPPSNG
jgi:hypothetical protein